GSALLGLSRGFVVAAGPVLVAVLVLRVEPGQPGRQPLDRDLELGIEVDELAQPLGEPGQRDLLLAAPVLELFDAAVGEVHRRCSIPCLMVVPTRARPGPDRTGRALGAPG